jgi:hypothetical protein
MVRLVTQSVVVGVLAAVVVFVALKEAISQDAALARDLRERGERVTVRVSAHEPRRPSCDLVLTGTLASGRAFTTRQIHPNGCASAPALGTTQVLVVLADDPTRGMDLATLDARDAAGLLPDDERDHRRGAAVLGLFASVVTGLVLWSRRRAGRAAPP